ncbi:twitching motility protein PilT [Campylobacterota bacterium]|nr:twitching motility protein PilT [Campylobacterota bacterium]
MYLLDTNIISELRKGKPRQSPNVRKWAKDIAAHQLYLSVITIMKIEIGILRMERKDTKQSTILRRWFEIVTQDFEGRILPFSAKTALLCAKTNVPNQRSFRDSMIAATAAEYNLALVTRNIADFEGLGIELINPF